MHIEETSFEETQPSDTTNSMVEEQAESGNAEGLAEGEGEDADEQGKRSKVQKRIDEITKARREAERERDYWRMQAEQKARQEQVPTLGKKPTPEDYDFDQEAYLEALTDYKVQEKLVAQFNANQKFQAEQNNVQQDNEFKLREYEVSAEFPDYHQKVYAPDVPITDTMAQAIRADENGARVAYFLASYKDIAYRVSQLSPREQFLAIGEISEKISEAQGASSGTPRQSKVSNAPAPPPTVQNRGSVVTKSPDKMSPDEFVEWRNKQLSKR